MSAIAPTMGRGTTFWLFDGTSRGASLEAKRVPEQHLRLVSALINGSATGAEHKQAVHEALELGKQPNWNGEGAEAVSPMTAIQAERLLLALPSYLPAPDIYADPTGAITFEWYRKPRHRFALSIYEDAKIEFAGLLGEDDEVYGSTRMGSILPPVIRDHLRQLFAR